MMARWRWCPAAAMVLALTVCGNSAEAFRNVGVGEIAPVLMVEDVQGKSVVVTPKDKVHLLLFWRPDQEFSQAALNDLEALMGKYGGKGVAVIAVAVRPGSQNVAPPAPPVSFPLFVDREGKVAEEYGVIVLPSTALIGSDGIVTFYLPSRNAHYQETIEGRLQLLLGEITAKELDDRLGRLGGPSGDARERAQARYASAHQLSQEAKWAEAAIELQEALKLAPDFTDARLQLGYAYLEGGQPEKALREFDAVLKRTPGSQGARMGVGIAKVRLGELEAGIEQLEKAIALNPNPVRAYYELGHAYERKGNLGKALHNYKWAIKKLLQGRM